MARKEKTFKIAAKTEVEKFSPKSHAGSALVALAKLGGRATYREVLAEVKRQRKLVSTMSRDASVRWTLFDLTRRGLVIAR